MDIMVAGKEVLALNTPTPDNCRCCLSKGASEDPSCPKGAGEQGGGSLLHWELG